MKSYYPLVTLVTRSSYRRVSDTVARLVSDLCQRHTVTFPVSGILSWLVYIIGAEVGGRVSFSSTDEHDAMDGELVCRSVSRFCLPCRRRDIRFVADCLSSRLASD